MSNSSISIAPRQYLRTTYEATMDVRYAIVFHRMNERLYNRMDAFMGAVGLIFGSAAFTPSTTESVLAPCCR